MSVGRSRKLIKRHVPSGKDWGELLEGFRSAWPIIIVHHGDADVDAVEQIAVLACDGQDEALSLSAPPVFEVSLQWSNTRNATTYLNLWDSCDADIVPVSRFSKSEWRI